eukprot:gene1004-121_t
MVISVQPQGGGSRAETAALDDASSAKLPAAADNNIKEAEEAPTFNVSAVPSADSVVSVQEGTSRIFKRTRTLGTRIFNAKFEDRRWLLVPGLISMALASFSFLCSYSQLLEAKPLGILVKHAEAAVINIWRPEIVAPCLEQWQRGCDRALVGSVVFACVGVAALCFVWRTFWAWYRFHDAKVRSQEQTKNINDSNAVKRTNSNLARPAAWIAHIVELRRLASPGNKFYWYRATLSFSLDVFIQLARGFLLDDAYARVDAWQCLEIAFAFTSLLFEVSYLAIRVSWFGILSLSTSSSVDFLTVFLPLSCPVVLADNERPDDYLLPYGVECYVWQYNFWLSPACSCIYMELPAVCSPEVRTERWGVSAWGFHSSMEHIIPHLNLRFLSIFNFGDVNREIDSDCLKDLSLLGSFDRLQSVYVDMFHLDHLPTEIGAWADLRSFEMNAAFNLLAVDENIVGKWSRLEKFECWWCGQLTNANNLLDLDLERLNRFALFGPLFHCDGWEDFAGSFSCTPHDASRSCANVQEWWLSAQLERVEISRERTICAESLCLLNLGHFKGEDTNNNLFIDDPASQHDSCFVEKIRSTLSEFRTFEEYPEGNNNSNSIVSEKPTLIEFLARRSGFSTCAECPFVQELNEKRNRLYNEANSDNCSFIYQTFGVDVNDACRSSISTCDPTICSTAFQFLLPHGGDLDLMFSDSDLKNAFSLNIPDQRLMQCLARHAPDCVVETNDHSPSVPLAIGVKMSISVLSFGTELITDCSACPDFPVENELSIYHPENQAANACPEVDPRLHEYCHTNVTACQGFCQTLITVFESGDFDKDGLIDEAESIFVARLAGITLPVGVHTCYNATVPTCFEDDTSNGLKLNFGRAVSIGNLLLNGAPSTCSDCSV